MYKDMRDGETLENHGGLLPNRAGLFQHFHASNQQIKHAIHLKKNGQTVLERYTERIEGGSSIEVEFGVEQIITLRTFWESDTSTTSSNPIFVKRVVRQRAVTMRTVELSWAKSSFRIRTWTVLSTSSLNIASSSSSLLNRLLSRYTWG